MGWALPETRPSGRGPSGSRLAAVGWANPYIGRSVSALLLALIQSPPAPCSRSGGQIREKPRGFAALRSLRPSASRRVGSFLPAVIPLAALQPFGGLRPPLGDRTASKSRSVALAKA